MNLLTLIRQSALGSRLYSGLRRMLPPMKIRRTVWGMPVYFDLRDSLYYLAMTQKHMENIEKPVFDVLNGISGPVWDVGCNIGLFSLYAASRGHDVTAFDISDRCIELLNASAARNRLAVRTVPTALSVNVFEYSAPEGAHTMNTLSPEGSGERKQSLSFLDAARTFGRPSLIKMDIEGAELDFFHASEFKTWLTEHRIAWLVEMHSEAAWQAVWTDVPAERLDSRHLLIGDFSREAV